MLTKKSVFLLGILHFFCLAIYGQKEGSSVVISGEVFSEEKMRIEFASVVLLIDSVFAQKSYTDSLGRFSFTVSSSEEYQLQVHAFGFKSLFLPTFELGEQEEIKLPPLFLSNAELGIVDIEARKKFIQITPDKIVILVEDNPLLQNRNAYTILKNSPGVSVNPNGLISLNGKSNVLITIDDQQTFLSSDQIITILKSTDASDVKEIEIITNPSAEYDASGDAGIINIIMVSSSKKEGLNGRVYAGLGYGWYEKASTGLLLQVRKNRFAWFVDADLDYNISGGKVSVDRIIENSRTFNSDSESRGKTNFFNLTTGFEAKLTEKTNLVGRLQFKNDLYTSEETHTTAIAETGAYPFNSVSGISNFGDESQRISSSIKLNHELDTIGSELSLHIDYSNYAFSGMNRGVNEFSDNSLTEPLAPFIIDINEVNDISIFGGKADWKKVFENGVSFKSGLKFSAVSISNSILFDVPSSNSYFPDTLGDNQYDFNEYITAGYMNLNKKIGKVAYQVGLRYEQTINEGISLIDANTTSNNYPSLFPSASAFWEVDTVHSLKFAFSRRITRPRYTDLNSFINYADLFTYSQGNPIVQPQFTNGGAITHTYNYKLFTTLGFDYTNDQIAPILLIDPTRNLTIQQSQNLTSYQHLYLNTYYSLNRRKFNFSVYGNVFNSWFVSDIQEIRYRTRQLGYSASTSLSYKIKGWNVYTDLSYYSPSTFGVNRGKAFYWADIGLSKSIGAFDFNLDLADVFNTLQFVTTVAYENTDLRFFNKGETRIVKLKITWNFGRNTKKTFSESSTHEELRRL